MLFESDKVMFEIYRETGYTGQFRVVYFTELQDHNKETEINHAMAGEHFFDGFIKNFGKDEAKEIIDGLLSRLNNGERFEPAEIERVLGHALQRLPEDAGGDNAQPLAPGMLASHYAPRTPVRLNATHVEPGEALLAFGSDPIAGTDKALAVMNLSARGDLNEAATHLFGYLRTLDAKGGRAIAVMGVPTHGLGEAINDRLRRAAIGHE